MATSPSCPIWYWWLDCTSTWHRRRAWEEVLADQPTASQMISQAHIQWKPTVHWLGGWPGRQSRWPWHSRAGAVQVRLLDQKQRAQAVVTCRAPRQPGVGVLGPQAPRSLGLCLQTGLRASGALANPQVRCRPCGMEGRMINPKGGRGWGTESSPHADKGVG